MLKILPFDCNEKSENIIAFLYPNLSRPLTSRFTPYFLDSNYKPDPAQRSLSKKKKGKLFISMKNIEIGSDQRTSIMIKNLPTDASKDKIFAWIKKLCKINYLYIPTNNRNKILGFAFVNVENYKDISIIYKELNGKIISNKKVEICYSKKQGVNSLTKSFGSDHFFS